MGTLDRPGITDLPDVPKELGGLESATSRLEGGFWLNTDRQPTEHLRAAQGEMWQKTPFHRRSSDELKIPELADEPETQVESALRGDSTGRWKPGDPVQIREFGVLAKDWDKQPGVDPPDYRNPDAEDTVKLQPGDRVIVGKQGSEDNPRRYATVGADNQPIEDDDDEVLEPRLPSGEDYLEMDDPKKSKLERIADTAKRAEVIEEIESSGARTVRTLEDFIRERPKPEGAYMGTPENPAVYRADRDALHGGELAIAPILVGLLANRLVGAIRDWLRHEKKLIGA